MASCSSEEELEKLLNELKDYSSEAFVGEDNDDFFSQVEIRLHHHWWDIKEAPCEDHDW